MNFIRYKALIIVCLFFYYQSLCCEIRKSYEDIKYEAFGFLKGQELTLEKILDSNPDLKEEVFIAQTKFAAAFGKSEKKLKIDLRENMQANFKTYENELDNKINKLLKTITFDRKYSLEYINEVEKRAEGEIPDQILGVLLTFQYLDAPRQEMSAGYTKSYSTKGHPKSRGVTINLKVPLSWKGEEAERPNITRKFTSQYGKGFESFGIMVKDIGLDDDYRITEEELNDYFQEEEFRKLIPDNSEYVSGKKIYLDGLIAGKIVYITNAKRLDYSFSVKSVIYTTFVENKCVTLNCAVAVVDEEELDARFELFADLFNEVANSLVFPDQYTINSTIDNNGMAEKHVGQSLTRKDYLVQNELVQKRINEGVSRIVSFIIIIIIYTIYKTIQSMFIKRKKLSGKYIQRAVINIVRLGRYSRVWAIIQFVSAIVFIYDGYYINFLFMTLFSGVVFLAGKKIKVIGANSINYILIVLSVSAIFAYLIPIFSLIYLKLNGTVLNDIGFLWVSLFSENRLIRFGPAVLTLLLSFSSISSIFSFYILKRVNWQDIMEKEHYICK